VNGGFGTPAAPPFNSTRNYRCKRKNCVLPDFGTDTCNWLPASCGVAELTFVQAPAIKLDRDCTEKPAAAAGQDNTTLLPEPAVSAECRSSSQSRLGLHLNAYEIGLITKIHFRDRYPPNGGLPSWAWKRQNRNLKRKMRAVMTWHVLETLVSVCLDGEIVIRKGWRFCACFVA
jgi:hypothetical protein